MPWTNVTNLPDPLVRLITKDTRDVSRSDYSVTELLQPARQLMLQRKYKDQIVRDVADQKDILLGNLFDEALRRVIAEVKEEDPYYEWDAGERQYIQFEVDGETYVISGEFDMLNTATATLVDAKVPREYEIHDPKDEKRLQLILYKYINEAHGRPTRVVSNLMLLKDWVVTQAAYRKDYAPHPIAEHFWTDIPSNEWVENFITERVRAHRDATEDTLCSDEERWIENEWAVMREDGSKAMNGGRFDSEDAAIGFASTLEDPMKHDIQFRPGEPRRCKHYCDVAAFCQQWLGEQ